MKTRGRHMATSSLMKMGSSKQSDDVPCAKEVLHAANRRSSRQHGRADLGAVVPYPIEWCGSCLWRVVVSEEAGFPSHRVAPIPFSAGAHQVSAHARTSGSRLLSSASSIPSVSSSRLPPAYSLRLLVLCLCHSLRLYIAYLLRFLPSSIAAASAINQQSIAPPRCVTPPPSNVLPRSKASRYASRVTSQVSSRYLRRQSRSSATLRGAVVSNIPTRHLNTNATTTLDV